MPFPPASASKTITVVGALSLQLEVDKTDVLPDDVVTFTARLLSDSTPVANGYVQLYPVGWDPQAYFIARGYTDSEGRFTYEWRVPWRLFGATKLPDQPYQGFKAVLLDELGRLTDVESNEIRITVYYPVTISIVEIPSQAYVGVPFTVRGTLYYKDEDGYWHHEKLEGATVNVYLDGELVGTPAVSHGDWSIEMRIMAPGTYTITAEFEGSKAMTKVEVM